MLVLVPVWALLVMMVTRRAGRHYPQHMVFALHANAAFAGAVILLHLARIAQLPWLTSAVATAVIAYILWYNVVALRTAYGGAWVLNAARTLVVATIYTAVLWMATMVMLAVALLI